MMSTHEAVHNLTYRPKTRLAYFRELPLSVRSAAFAELSWKIQQHLILSLTRSEVVEVLDHLDPRLASSILARLPGERMRSRLISHLKREQRTKAEHFLMFHPKAAISLIHFNYVLLPETDTVGTAASAIDEHWHATGKFPEVLVHRNGELIGEVHFATLVREPNRNTLKKYVEPIEAIPYHASKPKIIDAFAQTTHRKVVVLDGDGSVIGVIYSDDALEILGNEENSSLYTFAGVESGERPFDSMWKKVRRRWKWLALNLATAFLAASVIGFFDDLISAFVLLAVYLPIIAGMGGNAATQTLVVMVRGIAIGELNLKNILPALLREIGAGFVNGVIVGFAVMLIATIFNQSPLFGLVVGAAMIANLMIAGFFGTIIPVILKHFGKDPATGASIFITTATDVFGFLVFLGLASLALPI